MSQILTQDMAAQKYCPRLLGQEDGPTLCVATECMAWTWYDEEYDYWLTAPDTRPADKFGIAKVGSRDGNWVWRSMRGMARRGFCGLTRQFDDRKFMPARVIPVTDTVPCTSEWVRAQNHPELMPDVVIA